MIDKPLPTAANIDDEEAAKLEKDARLNVDFERKTTVHIEASYAALRKFNGVFFVH